MLADEQKTQIKNYVDLFKKQSDEYVSKKSDITAFEQSLAERQLELSKVAEEERQMEAVLEVLYSQTKTQSKVGQIEKEISDLKTKVEILRNELTQVKTAILEKMRNLPFPLNLEPLTQESSTMIFHYFEDTDLGENVIITISDLFRREPPLIFDDVTIYADKIVIINSNNKQQGINKLVESIKSFRLLVDSMLESYEKIDELIDRLLKSELSVSIVKMLNENKQLSTEELARRLKVSRTKMYDACYNLTRKRWSPFPIKKTPSNDGEITFTGELISNRLSEKTGLLDSVKW